MNNLHLMVRNLGRILLYIAPKDIISVPISCSWREKCQGFLCDCMVDHPTFILPQIPSSFAFWWNLGGNLFRLKSHIPRSTLAFVDCPKNMLIFLTVGFLFWDKYTVHPRGVFPSSCSCVREERRGAVQEFGSIAKRWKMNGVSSLIQVAVDRVSFLIYRYFSSQVLPLLPACPHFYLHVWGSCQPCCVGGWRGEILSVSWYRASLSVTPLPGCHASTSPGQTGIRCGLLDPSSVPSGPHCWRQCSPRSDLSESAEHTGGTSVAKC